MSNLYKRGSTISKDERVIDYNDIIKAKLQTILSSNERDSANPDGFVNGLNAEVVEALVSDEEEGAHALSEEQAAAQLQEMQAQAQQMVEDANMQAQQIMEDANAKAEEIFAQSKVTGYQEGKQQAQQELAKKQAEMNSQFEARKQQLEQEYEQMRAQMEPELVETLTEVFRKVTLTVAEDNQDIILHLINGVMQNSENSHEFVIKASPDDYKFLVNNQGKIYCAMSKEVTLDIAEDMTLKKNECIIETDTGVFNCSLDIELKNLIKDIKLLSCM